MDTDSGAQACDVMHKNPQVNVRYDTPTSVFASRVITFPKLQRKISLAMGRSMLSDRSPRPQVVPAISPEEHLNVQRYERMMDRFQLRHVPVVRTASGASAMGATSTSQREAQCTESGSQAQSRRPSVETPSTTAGGVDTARYLSNRMTGSIHPVASDADAQPQSRPPSRQQPQPQPESHASESQLTAKSSAERVRRLAPFSPTSRFTRWRLMVTIFVFTAKIVYMPYGIVYFPPDHPRTLALDVLVDAVFLLNILATCNTSVQSTRNQLITSRRAIWRHYQKRGLSMDVLATVPIELALLIVRHKPWLRWVVHVLQLFFQLMSLRRHSHRFYRAWRKEAIRADKSLIAWILYSRYGHLVRIGGVVFMITLMAHYFACVWSDLLADVDPFFLTSNDPFIIHIHSIYDALQLLQGQGLPTTTPAQDLFGSIAVLLGSIALAVIFGHVAILVSNFSANQTSYQRKMERVFAIMGKLQLPHPIRERVHQYYEYLHAEYESLDGEIVKFAKDLSHTLELEVVLFKYMDVVMHVPHWRECSPDFQKQLVLNLNVRVYLPDDFIMRRDEVGTECYIINRGTCMQHEYATCNYEPPTMATMLEDNGNAPATNRRRRSTQFSSHTSGSSRLLGKGSVRPQSRYSAPESGRSDVDAQSNSPYSSLTELKRGQSIGAIALLGNYERSSDLRAVTYVEMCVIERETFQRILTRYPRDREIVITSIVRHSMLHLTAEQVPCMLMQMVHQVMPHATVTTGIKLIAKAMNPRENDPSIVFGVTEQLPRRLQELVAAGGVDNDGGSGSAPVPSGSSPRESAHESNIPLVPSQSTTLSTTSVGELVFLMQSIDERLKRIEERQQPCCRCVRGSPTTTPSRPIAAQPLPSASSSRATGKLTRRHTVKIRNARSSQNLEPLIAGRATTIATATARVYRPVQAESTSCNTMDPDVPSVLSAPKRVLQELVGTLWSRSAEIRQEQQPERPSASPSPWADQLYQARRQPQPNTSRVIDPDGHRSRLHRTLSTKT